MSVDNSPVDSRAKSQIYNAGLNVKSRDSGPFDYIDDVFSDRNPSYVSGYLSREMMSFYVPNVGTVEMYINPQNFTIASKKLITEVRTKGGYVIQYWGEALDDITIAGTTGSSGIEGINILRDVYRAEHKSFSSVGTTLANKLSGGLNAMLANTMDGSSFTREMSKWLNLSSSTRPTLASLASDVSINFQGVIYRGFFTGFNVVESAETPGLFTYTMNFKSYMRRGERHNFTAWHRSPMSPANSDAMTPNYKNISNATESEEALNQLLDREAEQQKKDTGTEAWRDRKPGTTPAINRNSMR